MSTHNTPTQTHPKKAPEWLSGTGAARFLGFDTHAALPP